MTTKEILRPLPGYPETGGGAAMLTGQNPKKKAGGIEVEKHRGLTINDLPGKGLRKTERLLRWKMFQLGEWPPVFWRVPLTIEGAALMLLLEERHGAFYANVGGKKRKA